MKLRFALVGCGRIAQRHAEHINNQGILAAVCDIDEEKADALASKYAAKAYYDIDELLANEKEIDVVSVCSPNGLHHTHSIKALRSGFHVLCEKPMAINVHDCGEMINAAEKANKRLFAIKQNRFNPPVVAVKNAIDEGRLGKIYSVQLSCFWNRNADYYFNSWKGTNDLDGGTLYTQFSHFVDLLYWMVGDVKLVEAYTRNYAHKNIIEFEDTGVVILEFQNGALGTINYTVNSYEKNMEGSLTIFGEKGTIKIGGQYLNELEYQNIKDYRIENLPEGAKANNYGTYQGSMSNHDKVYENLINVLTHNASISTNAFEGLKTVEIIDKIYRAAQVKNTTPAQFSFLMEIAKIAIACFRKDLDLVKACVASIRYWYPDIEIFLIKDISQGDFSTSEIEKSFNVKLFPTQGKKFGWGWGKFALILGEKKERYLFLDSDVVLLGPVLQELNKHNEEFIVTGMKEENKYNPTINSHYIDMKELESFDPSYQYPGYGFNTGQIVITTGLLTKSDCAEVVEFEPTFSSKHPYLFKHADQGVLNYLLVKASQLNKCRIRYADFWIWPELPEAATINLDDIRSKKGIPIIMHWAGVKPTDFRKIARYDIFKFYEDYYYSKIKSGSLKKFYNYYKRLSIVKLKILKYTLLKMKYE